MATDKVDMSLDDIIKQQKKTRGGGRGRGRGGIRRGGSSQATAKASGVGRGGSGFRGSGRNTQFGTRGRRTIGGGILRGGVQKRRGVRQPAYTRGQVDKTWEHDLYQGELYKATRESSQEGKLLISNLDFGVNDFDIQELFAEFGPLLKAAVHYDFSGRSRGTAEVTFERKADALKALRQYNTVPLDGRPMKIQMVGNVAPQTSFRPSGRGGSSSGQSSRGQGNFRQGTTGGRGRGRGRGRGGRGGRGGSGDKTNLTREQLDAQLDAYVKMEVN